MLIGNMTTTYCYGHLQNYKHNQRKNLHRKR
jgi:hypothetical protein